MQEMVYRNLVTQKAHTDSCRPGLGVCTYFDSGYLTRALALYHSLARFHTDLRWYFFCMDDESLQVVESMRLPGVTAVSRQQLEAADSGLAACASDRSVVEYYFTCTASVILLSLRLGHELTTLFYVDADMCFFSSIDSLLDDMQNAAIYITEHRFPKHLENLLVYGRFNVGIIGVTRCEQAIQCLHHYRRQCIEWCFDRLESDRFADQKYLDAWPSLYSRLKISQHPGVNAAPWNKDGCQFNAGDDDVVYVNGEPLVCFHFHGLRLFPGGLVLPQAIDYGSQLSVELQNLVYRPYLQLLEDAATCGHSAKSRRYAESPQLLEVFRSRRGGRYWVRWGAAYSELTSWNALIMIVMIWLRRLLNR